MCNTPGSQSSRCVTNRADLEFADFSVKLVFLVILSPQFATFELWYTVLTDCYTFHSTVHTNFYTGTYELLHKYSTYEMLQSAYELSHTTYELLHTTYELLHTHYELLLTTNELLHTTYELLQTTYELF